jgi:ATP-dependent exoDNAse (exonuclease V) beta subunit
MIDEFQDTSAKEWENFVPLLRNAMSQTDDNSVLIVGDIKQSIYRWRGGDWRILGGGVEQALGKDNTTVEYMEDNYRSLKQVVEFNNAAIEHIVKADNESLNNELQSAAESKKLSYEVKQELTDTLSMAYLKHSQKVKKRSQHEGYVKVELFNGEEVPPIVECIESAIERGYSYKDILILCREKKDSERAANILLEYKRQNNSFNIMTQDSLIVGKSSINQFVVAVMRLSQNIKDSISQAIMNNYLGREYSAPLSEEELSFLARISQYTPEEAFEHIVSFFSLHSAKQEIAYLQALHEQIISFSASKSGDIQLFLKMWDDKGCEKSLSVEESDNTIELMTIHKAKGLEKKIVIIPYCKWGLNPRSNNFVWATPDASADDIARIGRFPINYKSDMENSIFSDDYFREKVYSHVDGINLLYVALTRAKEELYVFIPDNVQKNNVGKLLWNAVKDKAVKDESTNREVAEYGTKTVCTEGSSEDKAKTSTNILFESYPTTLTKMRLSLPKQRYYEEVSNSLTARNKGILMHSILSEATTLDDIKERIDKAYKSGKLDSAVAEELQQAFEREFQKEQVREWFGDWDTIRNENDIIGSHTTGTRRPDRVMIRGDRAVVVDYKFGTEHSTAHQNQVKDYIKLLQQMGYTRIEGYVWYISMGEIVKVDF